MRAKRYFSIRTKIAFVITILIALSLSLYVFVATRLFKEDKSAYIFETTLATVESLESQTRDYIEEALKTATAMEEAYRKNQPALYRAFFFADPYIVEFMLFEKKGNAFKNTFRMVNNERLKSHDLNKQYLDSLFGAKPFPFQRLTKGKATIHGTTPNEKLTLLTLGTFGEDRNTALVVRLNLDKLLDAFSKTKVFTTHMLNGQGTLVASNDTQFLLNNLEKPAPNYLTELMVLQENRGVREINRGKDDTVLVAFSKIDALDSFLITEIEKSKAFLVATTLTRRSVLFGIFIVSIAIITGLLLAKTLTGPIQKLFAATQKIAVGDFSTTVMVQTHDEIGVLADSFNTMTRQIVVLLGKEKERVALEQELAVAKLVQDSFFPGETNELPRVSLSSYYTPSTTCGGDWWHYIEHKDGVIILIGDATGHGVPSALITATASSCCATLSQIAEHSPEVLDSPATILSFLNHAVHSAAQGKIMMSFFVAYIDPKNQKLTYSNAAHNSPVLYRYKPETPSRKDLVPLTLAIGSHLGQYLDSTYTDESIEIGEGDVLVMFTDGLIEGKNKADKDWGKRNFLASTLKKIHESADDIKREIVTDAYAFFEGVPAADDITLVVSKIKKV